MSIRIIAAAALAGGAALLSLHESAMAQAACNGTVRHFARGTSQCYYLPTVSDGRVTGLQKHINIHPNYGQPNCRSVPIFTGTGRSLGSRMVCTRTATRPTSLDAVQSMIGPCGALARSRRHGALILRRSAPRRPAP